MLGVKMQYFMILAIFFLICLGCKKTAEKEPGIDEKHELTSDDATQSISQFSPPQMSEVNFDEVLELQFQIIAQPQDRSIRSKYLSKTYFKKNKALVSIGVARLRHPESGSPISRALVRRAARVDANRWASYGSSWIANGLAPDYGQLDTLFQSFQTEILSFNRGDSLYLAIASEIK
jgi:hypothetical protein